MQAEVDTMMCCSGMPSPGLRISGDGAINAEAFSTLEIRTRDRALLGEATMAARVATTHLCLEIMSLQRRVAGDGATNAKGFFTLEMPIKDHALPGEATMVLEALNMGLTGSLVG